jgi:hypothetical protein
MEVIRRMESGQSRLTLCSDLGMAHSNVTKLIKIADKTKKTMENAGGENRYNLHVVTWSCGWKN